MHVPDEVGRHRDEAGAALAQPAGQQQQLAERLGVVDVVVVVVPLAVDALGTDQRRGVVAGDDARVFLRQVERVGDAAEHVRQGLLAHAVHAFDVARLGERPIARRSSWSSSDRRSSRRSSGSASRMSFCSVLPPSPGSNGA